MKAQTEFVAEYMSGASRMEPKDPNQETGGDATGTPSHTGQASMERRSYQIVVEGHLDHQWSEWFEGLSITHGEDGTTVLAGPVADQAALHGLLVKIRNLGLPLISINVVQF
jgi:hypothetical protein